ncbi:hypothetical protein N9103_01335, partial [Akkermansiaceae bacterium]|nr:hypothetical protein [Akkermansiaceae bacterium]
MSNRPLKFAKGCLLAIATSHSRRHVNLPNSITFARLVLTAIFVVSASWGGTPALMVALITFV